MPTITCEACGHSEEWEHGNYFGERTNFAHHVCGKPGVYAMCGAECDHDFPGCALIPRAPELHRKTF